MPFEAPDRMVEVTRNAAFTNFREVSSPLLVRPFWLDLKSLFFVGGLDFGVCGVVFRKMVFGQFRVTEEFFAMAENKTILVEYVVSHKGDVVRGSHYFRRQFIFHG